MRYFCKKLPYGFIVLAAGFSCLTFSSSSAYDFSAYTPTLDRLFRNGEASIDSGYTLSFEPADESDYSFISYEVATGNNVIPVYYKINYAYDGGSTGGKEISHTSSTQEDNTFTGYFHNLAQSGYGGGLYNGVGSKISLITADFIDNSTTLNTSGSAYGGALFNGTMFTSSNPGTIDSIIADFVGNSAVNTANGQAVGGAVTNIVGTIKQISGNFINNHSYSESGVAYAGAIGNASGLIGSINGLFIANYASSNTGIASGGAVYSTTGKVGGEEVEGVPELPLIKGTFIANHASGGSTATGGAIANGSSSVTPDIYGTFIGNYAEASTGNARGGAIDAPAGINTITGSFIGNYAKAENGKALAGAVYVGKDMTFVADGLNNYFVGNYTLDGRGKIYNAVYVSSKENPTLVFDITKGGNLYFNDNIAAAAGEANSYNLTIKGYGSGKFFMNNYIMNAVDVTVDEAMLIFNRAPYTDDAGCGSDCHGQFVSAMADDGKTPDIKADAVTSLILNNAQFYLYNNYTETVKLKNYTAKGNSLLHVDVTYENGKWLADKLHVSGQISGETLVVVYDKTNADNRGASVVFIEAPNDNGHITPSVFRVYGSPYKWDVALNVNNEQTGSYWYLVGTNEANDSEYVGFVPDPIEIDDSSELPEPSSGNESPVYGEVVAYGALPAAALEQTRNMVDNIGNLIKNNRAYTRSCSFVDGHWNGEPYHNLWVNPTYYTSNIDSPFAIDADIWGIEAGGDIQRDINNRLGIFVSYRQGEYDMDGSGDSYRSPVGSEIDIDSYLAGLYYRYDHNNWYAFATLYGGIQEADIKTDDGMKSDTDGVEFGASIEAGYDYALTDSVTLTPELGVFYTQVNYDDVKDSMGKSASYDDARQIELEAGIKLSKTFVTDESFASVYVKPSVVQTIVDGDEVSISGLGSVETLDDATLGRIEIGGRYGFTTNLSAYGWANYTFGSDYDATTFGLGLNYAF